MATIKPMEIAFDDVKHIIIDILLIEYHCVLFYIWVNICPNISHLVCTQKRFCCCDYRGDYSAPFRVSGPL